MFFVIESNKTIFIKGGGSINQIDILPHNHESLRFCLGFSNFFPYLINIEMPSICEYKATASKSKKPRSTNRARGTQSQAEVLSSSRVLLNTSP